MYRCESWTVKKAERWRTDAFELWCWRRLLRVPWTVRRSNQSILKEINPEYSFEGLMLQLQSLLIGKDFDVGKDWGQEKGITKDEMAGWHHWLNGHEFEQALGDSEGQGSLACCSPQSLRVRHCLATEQQRSEASTLIIPFYTWINETLVRISV